MEICSSLAKSTSRYRYLTVPNRFWSLDLAVHDGILKSTTGNNLVPWGTDTSRYFLLNRSKSLILCHPCCTFIFCNKKRTSSCWHITLPTYSVPPFVVVHWWLCTIIIDNLQSLLLFFFCAKNECQLVFGIGKHLAHELA